MLEVGAEDLFEVAAADDQQVVETVSANGPNPALGDRLRLRRLQRRFDYPHAF